VRRIFEDEALTFMEQDRAVGSGKVLTGEHLLRRARRHDASREEDHPVAGGGLVEIVRGDDDGAPGSPVGAPPADAGPLETGTAARIDVRDPRNRHFGHIEAESMDPAMQTQDRLAVSASMRTALLVYSGITVKMMIDSDQGADLSTMFMVQYEEGGFAGAHDHPLEETYLILDGEVDAVFDGETYRLGPGDAAWAGVGCVHEFRNAGGGRVRWLETQAPQPPPRHSYRFARDWTYLEDALADERRNT